MYLQGRPEFEHHVATYGPHTQFGYYYYNRGAQWGQGVAINHKLAAFPEGTTVFDIERGQPAGIRPLLWQTDTSVTKLSWGYTQNQEYKTVDTLIDDLVDIVSKNGVLLLNIGPKADGTIPAPEQQILSEIGQWLKLNGEAIYGTRPWKVFGEGPTEVGEGSFTDTNRAPFTGEDIRFTTRGETLYAIALAWPGKQLVIRSLGANTGLWNQTVADIRLLGYDGPLVWNRTDQALVVDLPDNAPCAHACVVKLVGA
jgi:alpha-L-fucosidase